MKIEWTFTISAFGGTPSWTVGDTLDLLPHEPEGILPSLAMRKEAIRLIAEQIRATLERDLLKADGEAATA